MTSDRRQFLRTSGLILGFTASGALLRLSPAEARARQLPLALLGGAEAATLESLAEALVPGAREAGIAHFIDQQLAAPAEDNLLMLKYLGIAPRDQDAFYRTALGSVEALCQACFNSRCTELSQAQTEELLTLLAADDTPGWQGAPASFFFFVLRSDAADVVYGTASGIERTGMPLMTHIQPETEW